MLRKLSARALAARLALSCPSPSSSCYALSSSLPSNTARSFHSSSSLCAHTPAPGVGDLPAFFAGQQQAEVGDSWTAKQLRRKSFEDLQRLWFVLLREKNMLLTYKELCRQVDAEFVNHARFKKVGDSMSRIRSVLHERELEYRYAQADPSFIEAQKMKQKRRSRERKAARLQARGPPLVRPTRHIGLHKMRKKIKWRGVKPEASTQQE